jgi:hypothetical protein
VWDELVERAEVEARAKVACSFWYCKESAGESILCSLLDGAFF